MTWRRQSTSVSVDVDLDDFSCEQMLQGLIDAKWLTAEEASAITARSSSAEPLSIGLSDRQGDDLHDARRFLRMGNRQEALIYLERFLGRDWIGALH
jgi:hypothetical protein